MGPAEDFNIAGKDWLTKQEAAHYCGVSLRQVQTNAKELPISHRRFLDRKVYAKVELFQLIENSAQ